MSQKHKVVVSAWDNGMLIKTDFLFPTYEEAIFFGKCHSKYSTVKVYNDSEELVIVLEDALPDLYA